MLIPLASIRTDGGTQCRASISLEVVQDYAQATALPPVVVFHDGTHYWLADGFHRLEAAGLAGAEQIECDVRLGSVRDARLFAAGANASHGLRRTAADKEQAVLMLLRDPDWLQCSDRWLAEQARVGHPFVAKIREKFMAESSTGIDSSCATPPTPTRKKGRDGRSRSAPNPRKPRLSVDPDAKCERCQRLKVNNPKCGKCAKARTVPQVKSGTPLFDLNSFGKALVATREMLGVLCVECGLLNRKGEPSCPAYDSLVARFADLFSDVKTWATRARKEHKESMRRD